MLLNQRTYETEYHNYDTVASVLTEAEISQIKNQTKELPQYENELEMLYTIAVDWSITIAVVKYIMSL